MRQFLVTWRWNSNNDVAKSTTHVADDAATALAKSKGVMYHNRYDVSRMTPQVECIAESVAKPAYKKPALLVKSTEVDTQGDFWWNQF